MTRTSPSPIPRPRAARPAPARAAAADLAASAAERDRAARAPFAEARVLRGFGLLNLPAGRGGGWRSALPAVREIAAADGCAGQLLGNHYLALWSPLLLGADAPAEGPAERASGSHTLWGGALDPRGAGLTLTPRPGGGFLLDGRRMLTTGARVAGRLAVTAVHAGTGEPLAVAVDPGAPGVRRPGDRDDPDRRQSDGGRVTFTAVRVGPEELLGRPAGPAGTAALVTAGRLVSVQLYLGIAEGALAAGREQARRAGRHWPSGAGRAVDDPYLLALYGDLLAQVHAARALADEAVAEIAPALDDQRGLLNGRDGGREAGDQAALAAAAAIAASKAALAVTSRIFELAGGRSGRAAPALDRFWRHVRTHALQEPDAGKQREVGGRFLNSIPE